MHEAEPQMLVNYTKGLLQSQGLLVCFHLYLVFGHSKKYRQDGKVLVQFARFFYTTKRYLLL